MKELLTNMLRQYVDAIYKTSKWLNYLSINVQNAPLCPSDNMAYVISGTATNSSGDWNAIQYFNVLTGGAGISIGIPKPKSAYAGATSGLDKHIYMFGGSDYNDIIGSGNGTKYVPSTNTHANTLDVPTGGLIGASATGTTYYLSRIFIYGGWGYGDSWGGTGTGTVANKHSLYYSTDGNFYSTMNNLPMDAYTKQAATSIAEHNFLLVQSLGRLYKHTSTNAWTFVNLPVTLTAECPMCAYGNEVWIFNGNGYVYIYNNATNSWSSKLGEHVAHPNGGACVVGGDLVVVGGQTNGRIDKYTDKFLVKDDLSILRNIRDLTLMCWEATV